MVLAIASMLMMSTPLLFCSGTDILMKHVELPLVSLHAINFTQYGKVGARSVPFTVQIHGMFLAYDHFLDSKPA